MARLMSVAYTEAQVLARTKTVTRRAGWAYAKPGDRLTLCRKVMGRKAGEPLVRVAAIQVVSVRRESLALLTEHRDYGLVEVTREGFPDLNAETFIDRYFVQAQGMAPDAEVTRIEWRYLCGHPSALSGHLCGLPVGADRGHDGPHGAWQ